jgi:hypothetical protein
VPVVRPRCIGSSCPLCDPEDVRVYPRVRDEQLDFKLIPEPVDVFQRPDTPVLISGKKGGTVSRWVENKMVKWAGTMHEAAVVKKKNVCV